MFLKKFFGNKKDNTNAAGGNTTPNSGDVVTPSDPAGSSAGMGQLDQTPISNPASPSGPIPTASTGTNAPVPPTDDKPISPPPPPAPEPANSPSTDIPAGAPNVGNPTPNPDDNNQGSPSIGTEQAKSVSDQPDIPVVPPPESSPVQTPPPAKPSEESPGEQAEAPAAKPNMPPAENNEDKGLGQPGPEL